VSGPVTSVARVEDVQIFLKDPVYRNPKKCAGVVGCSCYIFELNHSINSKCQFLYCAAISFSARSI